MKIIKSSGIYLVPKDASKTDLISVALRLMGERTKDQDRLNAYYAQIMSLSKETLKAKIKDDFKGRVMIA